jgi:hypothetical protein
MFKKSNIGTLGAFKSKSQILKSFQNIENISWKCRPFLQQYV